MEKTISANELKSDPEAVLREVSAGEEVVLVESPEAPTAAIISLDEYRRFREIEDRQLRREAFERMERLRLAIKERTSDLDDEARAELAEELSRETMDRIIANATFRFVE
jgi:prevent-host-death family protein